MIHPNPHPSNNYCAGTAGSHLALDLKHRIKHVFAVFTAILMLCILSWGYTVELTWNTTSCPQSPATLTYNVYRGVTSGSYSQIASGLSSTAYSDSAVVYNTTYYYVVTGVCTCVGTQCSNGSGGYYVGSSESGYSTQFSASIPGPPTMHGIRTTGIVKTHGEVKVNK